LTIPFTNMFEIKKIISAYLVPPGVFVIILFFLGIWLRLRKKHLAGLLNILLSLFIWMLSIEPTSDLLMRGLEGDLQIPKKADVDVIILLGGASDLQAPDLTGLGSPNGDTLARVVTAVRLYKDVKVPIIVSSGKVFENKPSEANILKRFLIDLGVPEDKIIIEDKSRDTIENARYSKEICVQRGFKKPAIVTSAYHIKRSVMSFKKVDMSVIPIPAKFKTWQGKAYSWDDYLPRASNLLDSSTALREYIGLVFYGVSY
ncbi:MAG: YdcF family protein, partial [Thermodesulfovibrionales bacterium]